MTDVFNADETTARYLLLRREIAQINKECGVLIAKRKAEMEELEGAMMIFLNDHKMKSAPSANGIFYKEFVVKPSATDWTAFYEWIKENDAFEFLHKRITAEAVAKYMEDHKDDDVSLPPGVAVLTEYVVRVRTGTGE